MIIYSVLILAIILLITLTLASIFLPKLKIASESIYSTKAIYAADSALEWCLYKIRDKGPFPSPTLSGPTYQLYYGPGSTSANCIQDELPLRHRAVGNSGGISRALEID